jgi:hypothetical protein
MCGCSHCVKNGGLVPPFSFKGFMATFRCLQTGNTISFTYQHDIDSMRGHQGYVRVDEPEVTIESEVRTDTAFCAPVIPTIKRMGRPRKVANG